MISLTPSPKKNTIIETLVEFGVSIPPQLAIKRWLIVIGRLVSWLIIYIYILYDIDIYWHVPSCLCWVSPKGSLSLHLIDFAPVALPQELPRRVVLLGAPLLLQQGTGNGRDLLIIRDEPLWAKAWCQWTVKELHFLQDSRPLRFPKRHSLGGSCMCYLPGNNFFGPFYHTKKSLTIKFYRYTAVVYLPKKHVKEHLGDPGPPKGSRRGPAAALGHLQVDELPSLPWRGRRARSTRRAWSNKRGVGKVTTNEFLIAQWVILSWKSMGWSHGKATRWTHQMCFFPSTNLKKRDLQCYK